MSANTFTRTFQSFTFWFIIIAVAAGCSNRRLTFNQNGDNTNNMDPTFTCSVSVMPQNLSVIKDGNGNPVFNNSSMTFSITTSQSNARVALPTVTPVNSLNFQVPNGFPTSSFSITAVPRSLVSQGTVTFRVQTDSATASCAPVSFSVQASNANVPNANTIGNLRWRDSLSGNFTGTGTQYAAWDQQTGFWWLNPTSWNSSINPVYAGTWDPALAWSQPFVQDLNGDGKSDILGFVASRGQWWAQISTGTGFINRLAADDWSTAITWRGFRLVQNTNNQTWSLFGTDSYTNVEWVTILSKSQVDPTQVIYDEHKPVPADFTNFTANPKPVADHGSTTVAFDVKNAYNCSLYRDNEFIYAASGVGKQGSITATDLKKNPTVFTLRCDVPGTATQATANLNVPVNIPAPAVSSFTANPTSIAYNGSTNLTWAVTGSDECAVVANTVEIYRGTAKSYSVANITSDQTFTLTCYVRGSASAVKTASVQITSYVTATLQDTGASLGTVAFTEETASGNVSVEKFIVLTNVSNTSDALNVDIQDAPKDFKLTTNGTCDTRNKFGLFSNPNQRKSCTIGVVFAPKSNGDKTGKLKISYTKVSGGTTSTVDIVIDLSGHGAPAPACTGKC